jgi:hypothetical protein
MLDLLVGPAHQSVPCCLKRGCPYFITIGLVTMNLAVDLDNQASLRTVEVGDKAAERMLAPEFDPVEPAIAHMLLQSGLSGRLLASKLTSANCARLCCPSPLSHLSLFLGNVYWPLSSLRPSPPTPSPAAAGEGASHNASHLPSPIAMGEGPGVRANPRSARTT